MNSTGNLTLSGTVALILNPVSGQLPAGTYTLATYTGTLSGSASNLKVFAPAGTRYAVQIGSGALTITISATRAPAAIT